MKLWTSKKTGWILYPGIVVFLAIIAVAGMFIRIAPIVDDVQQPEQNLWQVLKRELLK